MLPDDLVIVNYCSEHCAPLQSVTRLAEQDAYALAETLSRHRSDAFTSFSRFARQDFNGYYRKRLRAEVWLYDHFVALGGKPSTRHPLYFVLGESDYLRRWYEGGVETKLRLACIDPAHISFTYGDSMSLLDRPERCDPFTQASLAVFLRDQQAEPHAFLRGLNLQNRYIEAQLWDDIYSKPGEH